MRLPTRPPAFKPLLSDLLQSQDPEKIRRIIGQAIGPDPDGKYRHWDKLRYLEPPKGLSLKEWWLGIKLSRQSLYRELPFTDKHGSPFVYAPLDAIHRRLHQIDDHAGGTFRGGAPVFGPGMRDIYYVKSLLDEAITSSQLEGAATTRMDAKEMLLQGRKPRNRHEQMIYNNYEAMQIIRDLRRQPLTREIILELQSILTIDVVDDPDAVRRFRYPGEPVKVYDDRGQILHDPPDAMELEERVKKLCSFANDDQLEQFIHPVLRAIILHFQLAYDHPFVDGNGRTARALFYWSMARHDYWLCEYISISSVLRKAPAQYAQAFLQTETDENDLTYFILFQLRVILRAIDQLNRDLERKARELHQTELLIRQASQHSGWLNHRQIALLEHALRNPLFQYTIEAYRRYHNLSYQTARTDLLELAKLNLLEQRKRGRTFIFIAPPDLQAQITRM